MSTYDRIKTLASNRGWSLQKLAQKAGIGINSIYRWKKMTPSTDNVQKVADVLQVSVDYLLGNTDNPNLDNEGSKPVDLSGTNIFTYQGQPVRQDDWEIIQAILERRKNSYKKRDGHE
ncbi:helix-turn-helix domain-containing protein [Lacticaseibacillus paracasei]|uniref:helix-turn-helix domain-containing protein n=1 Tax=Lacticaseibacillus paracasei TaxID=1597 RepID=UPI001EDF2E31|nr:helix-turn-helix transcriptional regulator [Lacticaseibacillus paracasei]MCG4283737.1 helix-turn-helix domain-containing protein [Lacticaseibacillus paracasei]